MSVIRSRDNPRVKAWMRLAVDPRERREHGLALIEGVHLVDTYLQEGGEPKTLLVSEEALSKPEISRIMERSSTVPVILADAIFKRISNAQTPVGVAAEIEIPANPIDPASSDGCVFLDGLGCRQRRHRAAKRGCVRHSGRVRRPRMCGPVVTQGAACGNGRAFLPAYRVVCRPCIRREPFRAALGLRNGPRRSSARFA